MKRAPFILFALAFGLALAAESLIAQEPVQDENAKAAELAKKLSNPVDSLISVPFQNNLDFGIGAANATRSTCSRLFPSR